MTRQARLLSISIAAAVLVTGLALHAQAPQRSGSSAAAAPTKAARHMYRRRRHGATPICRAPTPTRTRTASRWSAPTSSHGKSVDDVDDSEFAEIVRERQQRALASAAGIGGADTGAGPVHWYEHYNAKNSRAWLIVDPADGRIPPLTADGQKRLPTRARRHGRIVAAARRTPGRIAASTIAASRAACRAR